MAGSDLKEGNITSTELSNAQFNNIIEKLFYDSKKQTSYKLFLFYVICEYSLENCYILSLDEIIERIIKKYIIFFDNYGKQIKKCERDKNQIIKILEKSSNIKLDDLVYEGQKFLKNYMFGSLYEDTSGIIFGFSKKENKIIINNSLNLLITTSLLEQLNKNIKQFLLIDGKQYIIEVKEEKIGVGKMRYYQQKFTFELSYIIKVLREEKKNQYSKMLQEMKKDEIALYLGIGIPKYDAMKQFLEFSGLFENNQITELGKKMVNMKENLDFIEPLVYYNFSKNPEIGGHYIFSNLINEVIYNNYVQAFETNISLKTIKNDSDKMINHDSIQDKDWDRMIRSYITTLSNSDSGFGKMGILEELPNQKETFEVHSYWVEPLVAAYIIYDMWQDGQTAMSIDKITNDKYNLGRMFLMDKDAILETLEEIQYKNLITIESGAGLNQIRIKPGINKSQILDMIIDEA